MKAFAILLISAVTLQAGVVLTLTPAVQYGARSNAVVFTGILSNTTGDVFLNGIQITVPSELAGQSNAFFANVPGILASGQTYSDIVFSVAINSNTPPGNYSGTVTITGGADILGTNDLASQSFQVSASATLFDAWRVVEFGADTNNPAISDDLADPDGDGLANLLEYGLHLDPNAAGATGLPVGEEDAECNCLSLVYRETIAATDLRYTVEAADNPGGPWNTNGVEEVIADADFLTRIVRASDTGNSHTNASKRFMHLKVTRTP